MSDIDFNLSLYELSKCILCKHSCGSEYPYSCDVIYDANIETIDVHSDDYYVTKCDRFESILAYKDYLTTQHWKTKVNERRKIDGFKCAFCGSAMNLQCHHITYDNLFKEDVDNDLITLCKKCHEDIHKKDRRM